MALIGYARASTDDQSLGLQLDALRDAGCGEVFEDQGISGTVAKRPGLSAALSVLLRRRIQTFDTYNRWGSARL